jgi:hypothetical protein
MGPRAGCRPNFWTVAIFGAGGVKDTITLGKVRVETKKIGIFEKIHLTTTH